MCVPWHYVCRGLRTTSGDCPHLLPYLRQGVLLFSTVGTRLVDPQASGNSHFAIGVLGLQMHCIASGFMRVLGFQRGACTLTRQTLFPLQAFLNRQPNVHFLWLLPSSGLISVAIINTRPKVAWWRKGLI